MASYCQRVYEMFLMGQVMGRRYLVDSNSLKSKLVAYSNDDNIVVKDRFTLKDELTNI